MTKFLFDFLDIEIIFTFLEENFLITEKKFTISEIIFV